ncbi:hypothetical protein SAMN02745857_03957 [Andreprevotia lacus DSM 23236]|jgi:hypothetical protein|uniref:Uncharacterized protein n=1 Tax=Andreprevotia lacus DSM 23236 TaxID=1121001 RepID=A0A1W1Y0G0_9NEIS|nr:hypothetical protein SAMN02745857_03957 [Andreprevotia lacus DSM 23236]
MRGFFAPAARLSWLAVFDFDQGFLIFAESLLICVISNCYDPCEFQAVKA